MRTATTRVGAAVMLATAGLALSAAPSGAQPAGQKVTYTVTAQGELNAQIYYLATEPASQADYEADSAKYLTNIRVPLQPGVPWVFETTLADPTQWALVSASGALREPPHFRCEIAVGDQVVVAQEGASGTQCALRTW